MCYFFLYIYICSRFCLLQLSFLIRVGTAVPSLHTYFEHRLVDVASVTRVRVRGVCDVDNEERLKKSRLGVEATN